MLLNKDESPQKKYDVIVIGSGWGGLTSANILARQGYSVLLLESHNKLGGLATWFRRLPHYFDVSLHGFPQAMVKSCQKYWGQDISNLIVPLKSLAFDNPEFKFTTTYTVQDFKDKMVNFFKVDKDKVDQFFKEVLSFSRDNDPKISCGELFDSFFPNRSDIVRFLLEPITYANGHTLEDPAVSYGIVFGNFMRQGIYTMRCGTDQLMGKIKEELLRNNVDIKLRSKVEKIIVSNGVVQGIELDGEIIRAKSVISNSNLKSTIFNLVGPQNFNENYIQKAQAVRLNSSSCQVYLGLKGETELPPLSELYFYSESPQFKTDELLDFHTTSRTFSFYTPQLREASPYYTIVASTNTRYQDWNKLSEEEYKLHKEQLTLRTIQTLDKIIPGVADKICYQEAGTPLTIEYYTGHQQGAAFGTKYEGLEVSEQLPQQIQGLYHCGSVGIIMSGWLGAANYGVLTANEVENFLMQS